MEKFKLSFSDADFRINHKKQRVRCVLRFSLKGDPKLITMVEAFAHATNDPIQGVVDITVSPSNGDEFSVDTGCRVARARAEKLAYQRVSKFFDRFANFVDGMDFEFDSFKEKSANVVAHNEKYIKQF